MQVCPRCHNVMVYGMNCCTGRRLTNIMPPEPSPEYVPCVHCLITNGQHDEWKHKVWERLELAERIIDGLRHQVQDLQDKLQEKG